MSPAPTTTPSSLSTRTSSVSGAGLLIALQLGSRALTFALNQILLRFLRPELLGLSVQLDVYSISVLFFARESLRVAIQRQVDPPQDVATVTKAKVDRLPPGAVHHDSAAGRTQAVVNLAYISISLGAVLSVALAWLYLRALEHSDPSILDTPYFRASLKLFALSTFVELLSEPCFVVVQQKSQHRIRASSEAIATILRCLVTCSSAAWAAQNDRNLGLLPFALGQSVYSIALLTVYLWNVRSISAAQGFSLLPQRVYSSESKPLVYAYFSRTLLVLGASIFTQSIVKHILTQGDTILIATLAPPVAQGVYALVNNYGGLVARLILQPIEESSRGHFGKLLAANDGSVPQESILKARKDLRTLLKAYILSSVFVLSIGPTFAPFLLNAVAGPRWSASGAGQVIAIYCYYIPFLAVNGLTEAFVSSVATGSEINRQSGWMLAFSAGFSGAAFLFLKVLGLEAKGLVWANILNMAFRIFWSSNFIHHFFKIRGADIRIGTLLPRPLTIALGIGLYGILNQALSTSTEVAWDLTKNATISVVFAIIWQV